MPVKKKYEERCQKTGIVCRKGILLTNARGLAIKNQNFIHAALNCSKLNKNEPPGKNIIDGSINSNQS